MGARLSAVAVFAAIFVPIAISQWPAASLQAWVERGSNGRFRLNGSEGTLWNGTATLLVADSAKRWRVVQAVGWKLRWLEILRGRLAFDSRLEQGSALIALSPAGVSIEALETQLPAPVLNGLLAGPMARYGWTGGLALRAAAFHCAWNGYACTGAVEILWRGAGIAEISESALGSYRGRVVGEGQSLHFELATLEGRMQIAGSGDADAAGMRFTGEAYAQGEEADRLEAHLRTFGRRGTAAGKYILEYRAPAMARESP